METKTILIKVEIEGNSVARTIGYVTSRDGIDWQKIVESMIDTLEKSDVKEF